MPSGSWESEASKAHDCATHGLVKLAVGATFVEAATTWWVTLLLLPPLSVTVSVTSNVPLAP